METVTLLGFAGICLGGYFAIMNPLANTAVFIGLTSDDKKETKRVIANKVYYLHLQSLLL